MFEIFFKYPASIFHKGHFVFLTPWAACGCWRLPLAAAAGLLFWHVRRNHGLLSGLRPVVDLAARSRPGGADSVSAVAPGIEYRHLRPQQNVVAVLVDDSRRHVPG